ncbi:3904_t:CDS:2, partial [Gigaspora margarita]
MDKAEDEDRDDALNIKILQHKSDEEYLSSNDNYLDEMIANENFYISDEAIDNEALPANYIPLSKHKAAKLKSKNWNYFDPFEDKNNSINTVGHCAIHGITKDTDTKFAKSGQQSIEHTFQKASIQNPKKKKLQNQALVEFIIEDDQSLNILESKKFQVFVASLDPNYKLLTNKFVKQMIYAAYNYSSTLLTNQEWNILKSLVNVLLPFAEATTFLGSSKYSMIGFINPIINTLKLGVLPDNYYLDIYEEVDFHNRNIKIVLYEALQHYWKFPTENELLFSLLDPQYKRLEFTSKPEQKLAKDILVRLYNNEQNYISDNSSDSINNNYQSTLDNELS